MGILQRRRQPRGIPPREPHLGKQVVQLVHAKLVGRPDKLDPELVEEILVRLTDGWRGRRGGGERGEQLRLVCVETVPTDEFDR